MPVNRYFVTEKLTLTGQELQHFSRVMRGKVGDEIECINGKGLLGQGVVKRLSKDEAEIELLRKEIEPPLPFSLTLALGLLKPAHLEYALEKATEAGATRFYLFQADRSEKKEVREQYIKRLEAIVQGATKQCGRLYLPEIYLKQSLDECIEKNATFFGDLEEKKSGIPTTLPSNDITIVIGPESGFSEKERGRLLSKQAKPISLHPYTLRAETAACCATLLFFHKLYEQSR